MPVTGSPILLPPPAFEGSPFVRVRVYFAPLGQTRVEWDLDAHFHDPAPYTYQLQFAYSQAAGPADWANVGLPAADAFYLEDDEQRLFGKTLEAYYRVVLSTPISIYTSAPAGGLSAQDYRDWRVTSKILLQEAKRTRYTAVPGFLLKERRYGPPCPVCLDPLTNQPTRPDCPSCFGVSRAGGYFPAVPAVCDLGLDSGGEFQDNSRGTAKESVLPACRFAGQPSLNTRDLFVSQRSGRRWMVDTIREGAVVRGTTLVELADLRVLPFSDPLYRVPLTPG